MERQPTTLAKETHRTFIRPLLTEMRVLAIWDVAKWIQHSIFYRKTLFASIPPLITVLTIHVFLNNHYALWVRW